MATLGLVNPKEWLSRTKLTFARGRSTKLVIIDNAYAKYHQTRSDPDRQQLHQHLADYLIEKGRHWERVKRNTASGGLMKYIHDQTRAGPAAKKNVLAQRIPEARHGLIYLWQYASIETQWAKIALEGALSIGSSTASMLQASGYSKGEDLRGLGVIVKGSTLDKAVTYAGYAKNAAGVMGLTPSASGSGEMVQPKIAAIPEVRSPAITLSELKNDPTVIERAKHYFGSAFNTVYDAVRKAVMDIFANLKHKYQTGEIWSSIGGGVASLINFILGKVLVHAAPLVGNVIEIAQGIAKTILAAKNRIIAYMNRGNFVMSPGHPSQIANAIEKQMNWSIANGAYSMAKGGLKLGGNIASWGASALIDVIAACVEFAWRFISRIFESHAMKNWIAEVRNITRVRGNWKADPSDPSGETKRPAIVYDDVAFTRLFERGCRASPCIPMMTLNSGISGDQMMFMKMFDDTGGILGQGNGISSSGNKPSASAQAEFDSATKYLTHIKQWGRNYLEGTGFKFTSADDVARGLMWHAITHHKSGSMSTGDKVLGFIAG